MSRISQAQLQEAIQQLKEFVAIPSVSNIHSPDYNPETIENAANYVSNLLSSTFRNISVQKVRIGGSAPFILSEIITDVTRPTLLFYAHYDVQPVDRSKWEGLDPFVLTERDGRLYGRGASDDKGGIIAIIAALGAYLKENEALPFNVKFLFEGEEEFGSSHMKTLLQEHQKFLKSDALIVMDGINAATNIGTLTNSTRGLLNLTLEITSMVKPIHSGVGCLAPDPSVALAKIMVDLSNPENIPGFMEDCIPLKAEERDLLAKSSQTPQSYREDLGLFPDVPLRGDPEKSIYENITEAPSISFVNGGWGQPNGGNSIQETARCQIGVRLTAGQDPKKITSLLQSYLLTHLALEGFAFSITKNEEGSFAWKGDPTQPYSKMYLEALAENFDQSNVQPAGGTIPFLHFFKQLDPKMEIILPAVADPGSDVHSHKESQDLALFERSANSLISFFDKVGKI